MASDVNQVVQVPTRGALAAALWGVVPYGTLGLIGTAAAAPAGGLTAFWIECIAVAVGLGDATFTFVLRRGNAVIIDEASIKLVSGHRVLDHVERRPTTDFEVVRGGPSGLLSWIYPAFTNVGFVRIVGRDTRMDLLVTSQRGVDQIAEDLRSALSRQ